MPNPRGRPRKASRLHGTVASYKYPSDPCRCKACREAWRLYKKLYRRRRKWEAGEQAALLKKQGHRAQAEWLLVQSRNKS